MKSSPLLTTTIRNSIIVMLLGLVVFFQVRHDQLGPPFTTKLKMVRRNLLPHQILPYIHFGFRNIITDYYWISSIQDFVAWNRKEGYFVGYFKNISTLDPKFEYPYLFSILTIPQKDRKDLKNVAVLDEVATIAEKGMTAIPESWQIPFYLGTQYYLFTIYNNTDNEIIKKLAGKGIQEVAVTQLLEKGIIAYKERFKRYPKTVDEMLAINLIKLPEELLQNFDVEISPRDGSFRIREKVVVDAE